MSSSKLFAAALAVLSLPLLTTAHPTPTANTTNTTIYTLTDDLSSKNFFPSFSLFSSPDPTNGFVQYQNLSSAASASLLGYLSPNNSIYLGVDHTTKDASGRASLRLESNKSWNRGLLVADIRHMPASQCGVWPAFWMLSASKTWPEGGEIDILEGVNEAQGNVVTLHTSAGCVVEDRAGAGEFAGTMVTRNCDVDAPGQGKNAGCSIRAPDSGERVQMGIVREDMGEARAPSYGTGFNDAKGGVYAMEWTESSISVWFFPRDSPGYTEYFSQSNDTAVTSLDPSTWGPPMARFSGSGCDFSERFVDMKIVFNTAFCGEWAGKVWDEECAAKTGVETCEEYVRGNPDAFREAYWEVEGLRWFQKS